MEKLFLNVLNMSITSCYVILFVLIARVLLRKAPRIFSYCLWFVVLFRLICPFSFSSTLSIFRLVEIDIFDHIPADIGYMPQPQVNLGVSVVDNLINNSLPAAIPEASVNPMQITIAVSSLFWIIGATVLIIYCVISYILLKRKISTAMLVSGNIYESEKVKSPFVLGILFPRIYLPINLSGSERDYMLMHEGIHIKRFDYVIKPFAFFTLCFHWFNPLVWISFMLMINDMEMSCDESVLNRMGKSVKKDYSNSLLSLAINKVVISGSPLAFGESNVKARIKNVLKYQKPKIWITAVLAVIVSVIAIGLVANPSATKLIKFFNKDLSYLSKDILSLPDVESLFKNERIKLIKYGSEKSDFDILQQTHSTVYLLNKEKDKMTMKVYIFSSEEERRKARVEYAGKTATTLMSYNEIYEAKNIMIILFAGDKDSRYYAKVRTAIDKVKESELRSKSPAIIEYASVKYQKMYTAQGELLESAKTNTKLAGVVSGMEVYTYMDSESSLIYLKTPASEYILYHKYPAP